jgi:hypothetical protein
VWQEVEYRFDVAGATRGAHIELYYAVNAVDKKCLIDVSFVFFPGATQPIVGVYFTTFYRALASSHTKLLDHTQRRATVGRTPLNE